MQMLKDFMLRLKGDKKTQVIAGLAVIFVLALIIMPGTPQRKLKGV